MNSYKSKLATWIDKVQSFVIKDNNKPDRSGVYLDNKKTLEEYIFDSTADAGSGLLATRGFGFCFTLKQPQRWSKNKQGFPVMPFGGIGGKLESDESPAASLHREALEEVGSDVEIMTTNKETILVDVDSINRVSIETKLKNEPLPSIIFRSPKAEEGRKAYTNVLIYVGKFTTKDIRPIDDPALIELDATLLIKMAEKPMSVKDFKQAGGRITSRIDLPDDGFLKPIGTALAAARCLQAGLISPQVLE